MRLSDGRQAPWRRAGTLILWSFAMCLLLVWLRTGHISDHALRSYAIAASAVGLLFFVAFRRAAIEADPDDSRNYFPTWLDKLDDVLFPMNIHCGTAALAHRRKHSVAMVGAVASRARRLTIHRS